jgi:hypothetical protein
MIFLVKAILLFSLAFFVALGLMLLRLIRADTEALEIELHEVERVE